MQKYTAIFFISEAFSPVSRWKHNPLSVGSAQFKTQPLAVFLWKVAALLFWRSSKRAAFNHTPQPASYICDLWSIPWWYFNLISKITIIVTEGILNLNEQVDVNGRTNDWFYSYERTCSADG